MTELDHTIGEIHEPGTPPGVPETPLTDGFSETEVTFMNAEYNLLLPKLLNDCAGTNPHVVIAALLSAAGCVAVDACPDEATGRKYIIVCINDVLMKLGPAFMDKGAKATIGEPT